MAYRTSVRVEEKNGFYIVKFPRGYRNSEAEIRSVFPEALWSDGENGFIVRANTQNSTLIQSNWRATFLDDPGAQPETSLVVPEIDDDRLFEFQRYGVAFLASRTGAILADEMGLGKTVQSIVAVNAIHRGSGRHLVVVPNTLKENWCDEIAKWDTYGIPVFLVSGTREQRRRTILQALESDRAWVVINWEALRLHCFKTATTDTVLTSIAWDTVIADEAHRAKNRKAKQTVALKRIPSYYRWALTGTPIMNRPDEIWSVLNWLYPQSFTSYWRFFDRYVEYIDTYFGKEIIGPKNVEELNEMLSRIMIRRMKEQVYRDLPPKIYKTVYVNLLPSQKKAYKELVNDLVTQLENGDIVTVTSVMAKLVRLKQVAISIGLLTDGVQESSKIDALMDIIDDAGDSKVVVFSQFARAIGLVHKRLVAAGVPHVVLTGERSLVVDSNGTAKKVTRGDVVRTFQEDRKYKVYIGTTQAGGVGITLTAANTVIFLDKMWTPAYNQQAEDRLHRIGQRDSVLVISILAKDTIEEYIERVLSQKSEMIDSILNRAAKKRDRSELVKVVKRIVG